VIVTTALDLIKLAQKMAGMLAVGQTPLAEDSNDALLLLNSMLASWTQNRWLVYHLNDVFVPATGAISYTVGPAGDFNIVRPDRIESIYVRLQRGVGTSIDYPLQQIETYEEYADIGYKSLRSFPSIAFYDSDFPLGKLYIWPIPNPQFDIHMLVKEILPHDLALTDQIMLPPEYHEAILYNLCGRICLLYQLQVEPGVVALARAALNTIKVANHRVPELKMPAGLLRRGGAWSGHGTGSSGNGIFQLDEDVLG
jgi:hypothetical protein